MTGLFELKAKIFRFWSEYETYLKYIVKFVVALSLFLIVNGTIGFAEELSGIPLSIMLAAVSCFLPLGVTLFLVAALILIHLYVLSVEVAMMTVVVFVIVFLLYFRFAPHDAMLFAITPVFCTLGIPYVLPIATGLLRKGHSVASLVGGTVIYYFLDGVYQNVKNLQAITAGSEIQGAKMSITAGQILENTELYLMVLVFTVSTLAVYNVRKMAIKHAWKIAIVVGILIQISGLLIGYILYDITEKMIGMLMGNILAAAVGLVIEFLFMNLDYSRTERVQFEDDEYYYFVKAVPKKMIAFTEKTVTEFNGIPGFAQKMRAKKDAQDKVTRKNIADELEIDEELLK